MTVSIDIIYLASGVELMVAILALIGAYHARLSTRSTLLRTTTRPPVVVLLPALREQKLVARTLTVFTSVFPRNLVMPITSTREDDRPWQRPTTADRVDSWIADHPHASVRREHEQASTGSKATQMNYGISMLERDHGLADSGFIAVYDFDSAPHPNVTRSAAFARPDATVVQQVPLPFANFNLLPRSIAGTLLRVEALSHTTRSIGIEYCGAVMPSTFFGLKYAMGAGLFVRLGTLQGPHPFPDPCDDIPLGYSQYLQGVRKIALPYFNLVEIPRRLRDVFGQLVLITRGVMTIPPTTPGETILRRLSLLLHITLSTIELSILPWLLLVLLMVEGTSTTWFVFLATPAIRIVISAAALTLLGARLDGLAWWPLALAAAPLRRFWRTFGFFLLLFRSLSGSIVFTKTDRS